MNFSELLLKTDEQKFCFGRVLEITDYQSSRKICVAEHFRKIAEHF